MQIWNEWILIINFRSTIGQVTIMNRILWRKVDVSFFYKKNYSMLMN